MNHTRDEVEVSTVEMQIAERARKFPDEPLTNLHQFIKEISLYETFALLNRTGAAGVDNETWFSYDERWERRLPELLAELKSGKYRAPNIRRAYIPKGDGKYRPLGIPTIEDKILQTTVSKTLSPVYEQIFYPTSYGFRKGKSQHQAIRKLSHEVNVRGIRYIIDADMKNYFGSINHQRLREFLDERIKDGVLRKMIDKWLKAGVLEKGKIQYPKEGAPQGGSISPLLSNIYLHYVLDQWFTEQIQPRLKGKSFIIRYADDFLLGFTREEDAARVMEVLPKRLGKYDLTLHPEKTKLVKLEKRNGEKPGTFDFLGFTHYMGKTRRGRTVLKHKTSRKKLQIKLVDIRNWIRLNRHKDLIDLIERLNLKLIGHYAYYGITYNMRSLKKYYRSVMKSLHYWLNRRGGRKAWNWDRVKCLIEKWIPVVKPRINRNYRKVKP